MHNLVTIFVIDGLSDLHLNGAALDLDCQMHCARRMSHLFQPITVRFLYIENILKSTKARVYIRGLSGKREAKMINTPGVEGQGVWLELSSLHPASVLRPLPKKKSIKKTSHAHDAKMHL